MVKPKNEATCERCLYWQERTEAGDEVRWGECRESSPQVWAYTDPNDGSTSPAAGWPDCPPDAWCGKFRGKQ